MSSDCCLLQVIQSEIGFQILEVDFSRSFPVNLAKFLRTLFLQNTSRRLLLQRFEKKLSLKIGNILREEHIAYTIFSNTKDCHP